jgi:hypothetical protein
VEHDNICYVEIGRFTGEIYMDEQRPQAIIRGIGIVFLSLLAVTACNNSDSDSDIDPYVIRPSDGGGPLPPPPVPTNQTPVINSVTLTPSPVYPSTDLTATVDASDPEGDTLQLSYSWKLNDVTIAGETSATLSSGYYDVGDTITLTIHVSDGRTSAQDSANIIISALPYKIVATPPTNADYGATYSFQIDVLDENNNPLAGATFELLYGPYGFTIDQNGLVSWLPNMPLFESSTNISWGIRVIWNSISDDYEGSTTLIDTARQAPLARSGIEVPYSDNGMLVDDLDGNGTNEVLIAGRETHLFTLTHDAGNYKQDWFYPYALVQELTSKNLIWSLTAHDIDGNGVKEVIVGSGDDRYQYNITVIDLTSNKPQPSVSGNGRRVKAVEVADVDADGNLEIVSLIYVDFQTQYISIRDANTLDIEWESALINLGWSLKIGEVDGTVGLEIITANGYVYGYNGTNFVNEWLYSEGFGYSTEIGDVTGSGVAEIVGDGIGGPVRVFSAVSKNLIAETTISNDYEVALGNLDSDPELEIVAADSTYLGKVRVYSLTTSPVIELIEDQTVQNLGWEASGLSVGDADNDGKDEILWGIGVGSTGEDSLVIAGIDSGGNLVIEWNNIAPSQLDGPFIGGQLATIQPGIQKLLFGTARTDSGYAGTRIMALDPVSGDVTISSEQGSNWSVAFAMTTADYDGDGIDEAFFSTAEVRDGYGIVFDLASDSGEWLTPAAIGDSRAVAHGKMDADDHDDFLYLREDGILYIFDSFNSVQLWAGDTGQTGRDVEVADLDGDTINEFVTAANNSVAIYKKDGGDYVVHASFTTTYPLDYISDLAVGDFNGDGELNIAVLIQDFSNNGLLTIYDKDLNELTSWRAPMEVSGIVAEQLGSGKQNIVLTMAADVTWSWWTNSVLAIMDAMTGKEIMRSPYLPGMLSGESVHYVDVNQDGMMEISFGSAILMGVTR